jgi:hypothetical protein
MGSTPLAAKTSMEDSKILCQMRQHAVATHQEQAKIINIHICIMLAH